MLEDPCPYAFSSPCFSIQPYLRSSALDYNSIFNPRNNKVPDWTCLVNKQADCETQPCSKWPPDTSNPTHTVTQPSSRTSTLPSTYRGTQRSNHTASQTCLLAGGRKKLNATKASKGGSPRRGHKRRTERDSKLALDNSHQQTETESIAELEPFSTGSTPIPGGPTGSMLLAYMLPLRGHQTLHSFRPQVPIPSISAQQILSVVHSLQQKHSSAVRGVETLTAIPVPKRHHHHS